MSILSSKTLAVFSLIAFAGACTRTEPATPRATVDAAVVTAESTSLPSFHSVAGTVRAQNRSTLAANVVGTVARVLVAEGDRVRAGDVVIEIDSREPRANAARAQAGRQEVERAIEAASANARLATSTYARIAALRERGSASQQEYDEAKARQSAAQADLERLGARRSEARAAAEQASAVLAYSSLRAPTDGVITARNVDPGAQAAPGVPLLVIEEERATRVDASLPETVQVKPGDRAVVDAGAERIEARVTRVQPSLDAGGRTALVQLQLPRPLRAGMYVKVSFPVGEKTAVTVPVTALVKRGQLTSVFVVGADGVARMRLITIGSSDAGRAEVLSGIQAGETIVSSPAAVRDGVAVRRRA